MRIYFTELEDDGAEFFQKNLSGFSLEEYSSVSEMPEDAEVVCIFIHDRIDEAFLNAHPKVRLMLTRSTSVDHIDIEACTRRKIPVVHVAAYGEESVAEHVFALLLSLTRRLQQCAEAVGKDSFSYSDLRGWSLQGKTMGVLGTGRVGLHVIRIAKGFGMKVIACDAKPHPFYGDLLDFEYVSFGTLLEWSDVISLHVPHNESNYHLFNAEVFKRCKNDAVLINAARGPLVDTDALLEALDKGQIRGAGLDVIEEERIFRKHATRIISEAISAHVHTGASVAERYQKQKDWLQEVGRLMKNKKLISHPKVVFTPHVAFNTEEAHRRINEVTLGHLLSYAEGRLDQSSIVNYELLAR